MKTAVLLAMIPLGVFGMAWGIPTPRPAEIVPVAVTTEGVRKVSLDTRTFRARWLPVTDMPIPVTYVAAQIVKDELQSIEGIVGAPLPTPRPYVYSVPGRKDICARHRMRKVWVSSKRWICKR